MKTKNKQYQNTLRNIFKLFSFLWNASRSLTIVGLCLRVFRSIQALAILFLGKNIIDEIIRIQTHHSSTSKLWQLVSIECVLALCLIIGLKIGINVEKLHNELFTKYTSLSIISHASKLDLQYFENPVFYDKLDRSNNSGHKRLEMISGVLNQFQSLTMIVFLSIGLISSNAWIVLIVPIFVLPAFLGEKYFSNQFYSLFHKQTAEKRQLNYYYWLGSSAQNAKEVRVFDLAGFIHQRLRFFYERFYISLKKISRKSTLWGSLLSVFGGVGYYFIYIYIINLTLNGNYSIGEMLFISASYKQLNSAMEQFLGQFNTILQNSLYVQDFFDFFNIKPLITNHNTPRPFPNPIVEGFVFEDISFKYFGSDKTVLENINLKINAGEKIALVGENGAGKTTFIKLLARLYEPTKGRILLDGHDLREYDIQELRYNIGIIFQDFLKYEMSLGDNIRVGNLKEGANFAKVEKAATNSLVHLLAEKYPNSYETLLGRSFHNGVELSGGEWQRVAIARAYMRDAQLLILDEPTAALDAKNEYYVFKRFSEISKTVSAIFISHKFSTVRLADRIIVLENGQIIESGCHEELLAQNGKYSEMFNLQAEGYR